MTTTQQDKPGGKPRQRNRKADQRSQKSGQQRRPTLDQREEEQVRPMVASSEAPAIEAAAPVDVPLVGEVLPPVEASTGVIEASDTVSIQTIANAYRDYTRKSFQESRFLVEKLMGVRSFDKAVEVQTEFARQAYANFVAESQKMCELYSEFTRQTLRPWEELSAGVNRARR